MKVLDPGHSYELEDYDPEIYLPATLFFMKRIGPHYPGNEGKPHHGPNCQEVLRVLIDRVKYLDKQIPCTENKAIIMDLRRALWFFESRAARIKGRSLRTGISTIENAPTCKTCGHIECTQEGHENGLRQISGDSENNKSLP